MPRQEKFFSPKRESSNDPLLARAEKKAQVALGIDSVNPTSFYVLYGEDVVKHDQAEAEELAKKYEQEAGTEQRILKKRATVLEAIIHIQAELNKWFGEDAHSVRPSLYDDILHGIDEIIEFRGRDSSYLALGIDVTFSTEALEKKFSRIRREIEEFTLATIKYLDPKHRDIKVPRVIVSISSRSLENLTQLWIEGKNKTLGLHPIQMQILEEIKMQLNEYYIFAMAKYSEMNTGDRVDSEAQRYREIAQRYYDIAQVYKKSLKVIGIVIDNKKTSGSFPQDTDYDGSVKRMKDELLKVFGDPEKDFARRYQSAA